MSRIGKRPVPVPSGVTATVEGQRVKMKGTKGELSFACPAEIKVEKTAAGVAVSPRDETKDARAKWGMSRTMVQNLITGVTQGYTRVLEVEGVGYKAALKGKTLNLQVGLSHDVNHEVPKGLEVKVESGKQVAAGRKVEVITVNGIDKQLVGQFAAEVRASQPPEPYQGKGVRYQGEFIFRKEGKKK